jgi:peptidyl-prolyl cis-trans isomerase D
MFDTVRNNKLIVQGFLALITLPFALWGVESYVSDASAGAEYATVGSVKIGAVEFQEAMRDEGDRLQRQLRERFDPRLLETPEAKQSVLNGLVNQRLLALAAKDAGLSINDQALVDFISQVPALQEDGKFSPERYKALVSSRNMSTEAFEMRLRKDMLMQQLVQPVGDAALSSKKSADIWVNAQLEQRTVAEFRIQPESFAKQVKPDDAAISAYYEANRSSFELPSQVRVEYVVLDQEAIAQQIDISGADIEARYKSNPERYTQAETRRASHILITLASDASEADVTKAQSKATELSAQVKKNPKEFAELAKKHSQDTGSAAKGGDLDWFGKGMMVKAFEDAVFALKNDEISGVIRSDFGLHIIRLTGVRPERVTPLAEVRSEIVSQLRQEQSTRKFAEAVEGFTNTVYEQSDSLQPVAEQFKLTLKKSDWLKKGGALPVELSNPKLAAAVFSDELIKKQQNSEAIELAPGKLAATRVIEHRPVVMQPLADVKAGIVQRLVREGASAMVKTHGQESLQKLNAGEGVELKWSSSRGIVRAIPQGLSPEAAKLIFSADLSRRPAYVGTPLPDGSFVLYKIIDSIPAASNDPRREVLTGQYARQIAEAEFGTWIRSLRAHYGVTINEGALKAPE